jgi:hypothetical protein
VGAQSFLHDQSLARLHSGGWINDEMVTLSREIREKWLDLRRSPATAEDVRTKKEWHELSALCDRAKGIAQVTRPGSNA